MSTVIGKIRNNDLDVFFYQLLYHLLGLYGGRLASNNFEITLIKAFVSIKGIVFMFKAIPNFYKSQKSRQIELPIPLRPCNKLVRLLLTDTFTLVYDNEYASIIDIYFYEYFP